MRTKAFASSSEACFGCLLGPVQGALTIFNTCLAGGNEWGREVAMREGTKLPVQKATESERKERINSKSGKRYHG